MKDFTDAGIFAKRDAGTARDITVLVAEDEDFNYFFLEQLFEINRKYNTTLLHALNGKEAVEIFENNRDIDVVLMDIKMPVMDGYEATKKLKSMDPGVPVIIQTSYTSDVEKEKAKQSGCDEFLTKPIDNDELFEHIEHCL